VEIRIDDFGSKLASSLTLGGVAGGYRLVNLTAIFFTDLI